MYSCGGNHPNGSLCLVDNPCPNCQRAMGVHPEQRERKRILSLEEEVSWLRKEVKRLGGRLKPPTPKRRDAREKSTTVLEVMFQMKKAGKCRT